MLITQTQAFQLYKKYDVDDECISFLDKELSRNDINLDEFLDIFLTLYPHLDREEIKQSLQNDSKPAIVNLSLTSLLTTSIMEMTSNNNNNNNNQSNNIETIKYENDNYGKDDPIIDFLCNLNSEIPLKVIIGSTTLS